MGKRVAAYCLTGSGNTRKVMEEIGKAISSLGHGFSFYNVKSKAENIDHADILLIGYPVHAFNAPRPIIDFIKRLPKAFKPIKTYLIQSSGEPLHLNFAAQSRPLALLKKKGYEVLGGFSFVMPYNIIFRHKEEMARRMWGVVKKRIPDVSRTILGGEPHFLKISLWSRPVSFVLRIEQVAMPLIGRHFKANGDCVSCGLCASSCPVDNIVLEKGLPKFGKHCIGCMGCVFLCPRAAIQPSLFKAWKVNGPYSFKGEAIKDKDMPPYCRKAYLRYFHTFEDGAKTPQK